MTECQEVAETMTDKARRAGCETMDECRRFVRAEMPGESETLIDNVAWSLSRNIAKAKSEEHPAMTVDLINRDADAAELVKAILIVLTSDRRFYQEIATPTLGILANAYEMDGETWGTRTPLAWRLWIRAARLGVTIWAQDAIGRGESRQERERIALDGEWLHMNPTVLADALADYYSQQLAELREEEHAPKAQP